MTDRGCRKKRYGHRKQALTAMNTLKANHRLDPRNVLLRVYHCRQCRGWHVGHGRTP